MSPYIAEFIGTYLLITVGAAINANVVLAKTKGNNSGWIVISIGWGIAVFLGVYSATSLGGSGHLNPAVSIGLSAFGGLDIELLGGYVVAQILGAFFGAITGWMAFIAHFRETTDPGAILAVFSTAPAIRNKPANFLTEAIGTFVLVLGALSASAPESTLGALDALPVGLLVMGIGMGLGGPTGYAINPARDLGPRIAHALLPIRNKGTSDWDYAWVPILGPIAGGILGAGLHYLLIS
ncbi:MAG TPA: aquaporin [Flavobacteriales bacterium]|jgi:glycerol uptake facilitator protein|nr:aquaporin [Flavobacteriales bacterium]